MNRATESPVACLPEPKRTLLVQQFASMEPSEFGPTIDPKWQVGERLVKEVKQSAEKSYLTPLEGLRPLSFLETLASD